MGSTWIEIINWEAYYPRSDIKHPVWFRFDLSLFENPDFFDFTPAELLAWIYFLSMAAKKGSARVLINHAHAERLGRLDLATLSSALRKLQINHSLLLPEVDTAPIRNVHVRDPNEDVQTTYATRQDKTGQDKTGEEKILVCTELEKKHQFGAISQFLGDPEIEIFLGKILKTTQERWIKLYQEPSWIRSEFLKALAWLEANPQKAPKKNMARFMGSWLSRGWEHHRKTVPSNPVRRSISDILGKQAS